jgi:Bardet-Biedl syndrome 7 protein
MSLTSLYEANLKYTRNDITTSGTCQKDCMRILPQGKKARSKVVMADHSGVATMFQVGKHHEVKVDFKTAPEAKGISAVELYQDQIFLASGSRISAYTKKGRPFFALETNMSETIRTLKVDTPFLFIGGDYVLTRMQESTELGYFMCADRIHATILRKKAGSEGEYDVYAGCQDRCIRTLKNGVEKGPETAVEAPVQAMAYLVRADKPEVTDLVYGTASGSIGGFGIGAKNELIRRFTLLPDKPLGGVVSIATCDITKDGFTDIVVGRDDGTVDLFSFNKNPDGQPVRLWSDNVAECVNTVDCGCVTNAAREEIVLHTYPGKVLSFTVCEDDAKTQAVVPAQLQGPQEALHANQAVPPPIAQYDAEVAPKVQILERKELETAQEIQMLKDFILTKKAEFAQLSSGGRLTQQQALAAADAPMRAVTSNFGVREKMVVDETGLVAIHLEVDTAIESIAIQSDLDVELIDYGEFGSNAVILPSKMPSKDAKMCALARPLDGDPKKVVLRFKVVEGLQGTIRCFITPKVVPKSAQLKSFTVRPLSLHQRIDLDPTDLPLSTIKIDGAFSAKDAHAWLFQCLPDVPQKYSSEGKEGPTQLCFRSNFIGTVLVVKYQKGSIEFSSENLTTLTILKEFITKEATLRKIAVAMSSKLHPESVPRVIQKLHPLIEAQVTLMAKHGLLEALREVESQEQSTSFLSQDYKDILAQGTQLEAESKRHGKQIDYLKKVSVKLLIDLATFRGQSVPLQKILHVEQIIADRYDGQLFLDTFMAP